MGVGLGQGGEESIRNGLTLALAIGLQDLPEGLGVAAALIGEGYGAWKAIGISTLTGLVETVGGVLGVVFVNLSNPCCPGVWRSRPGRCSSSYATRSYRRRTAEGTSESRRLG